MTTPKWAVGMERITPGAYVDAAGNLHIDTVGLCEAHGVTPTLPNQMELADAAGALWLEIVVQEWAKTEPRNVSVYLTDDDAKEPV